MQHSLIQLVLLSKNVASLNPSLLSNFFSQTKNMHQWYITRLKLISFKRKHVQVFVTCIRELSCISLKWLYVFQFEAFKTNSQKGQKL